MREAAKIPAAKAAVDAEWKKLWDMRCWLPETVIELDELKNRASKEGRTVHIGRVHPLCVVKHSELAPEFHKYKGRVVFLGNQVNDQDDRAATFREMQSGTNLMSAGKFLDIIGASPGCGVEIADALQAYTQCELGGDETWVELPRDQFPKTWKQFRRPVVRLRLALYGHPLSGAFWEQYCATQLKKVGFEQIPQWEGCYVLRRLGLVLSVYVDDLNLPDALRPSSTVGKPSAASSTWTSRRLWGSTSDVGIQFRRVRPTRFSSV
jgi:hypothetical protein